MKIEFLTRELLDEETSENLEYLKELGIPVENESKKEGELIWATGYIRIAQIDYIFVFKHPKHGEVMSICFMNDDFSVLARVDEELIARFEELERNEAN